jgi:hypothetical protein
MGNAATAASRGGRPRSQPRARGSRMSAAAHSMLRICCCCCVMRDDAINTRRWLAKVFSYKG